MIDYAGLFPPAKLDLKTSFSNFIQYKSGKYELMLSKFICTVRQLPELNVLILSNGETDRSLSISAISAGGNNAIDFKNNLEKDLVTCKEFLSEANGAAEINSLEARIPDDLFKDDSKEIISDFVAAISDKIKNQLPSQVSIFLEGRMTEDPEKSFGKLIQAISDLDLKVYNTGFKLRTGGAETSAFPSAEQIAYCIRKCLDSKVPMKFTAGLHHPFRHFDTAAGVMMHGFINVFGAGIIAMRHDISDMGMREILEDQDPDNFIFTDEYFSWKGWQTGIEDIMFARKDLVLSYGSCSFDEPVDDLKALNLL